MSDVVNLADRKAKTLLRAGQLPNVKKVEIVKPKSDKKKYRVIYSLTSDPEGKVRHLEFGDPLRDDFLVHKDQIRRKNFNNRFRKLILNAGNDPTKKAYWFKINW